MRTQNILPVFLVLLLAGAGIVVLAFPRVAGQTLETFRSPGVILEVTETNSSISENSENTYLYLRVLSDGAAECQSPFPVQKSESNERRSYRKALTHEEFNGLQSLIDQPEVLKIRSKYDAYISVDTSSEWEIKLQHHGEIQTIVVGSFFPGLAREFKHPYPTIPTMLTKLGCTVQKLRHEVTSNPDDSVSNDCRKVLHLN